MREPSISKGAFFLISAFFFQGITGYLIHLGVGRFLGPSGYGIYVVILEMLVILQLMLNSGVPVVASKLISEKNLEDEAVKRTSMKVQGVFAIILFVLYFFSADLIASLLNDSSLSQYIKISSVMILFYAGYSLTDGFLNGLRDYFHQAVISILNSLGKVALIFLFLMLGFSIKGAVLGFSVAPVVGLMAGLYFTGFIKSGEDVKFSEIMNFSFPLVIASLMLMPIKTVDVFFVKALVEAEDSVGFYAAASILANILILSMEGISRSVFPAISHSTSKKLIETTKRHISLTLRYSLLSMLPLALLMSASSNDLITLFFSEAYAPAGEPLGILSIGLLFFSFFLLTTRVITASGKPNLTLFFCVITLLLNVGMNYILIPLIGIIGAAVATAIACLIGLILSALYIYREFGVLMPLFSFIRITSASVLVYAICLFTHPSGLLLIPYYVLLAAIYLLVLKLVKELKTEDVDLIKRMLFLTQGWRNLRGFNEVY